MRARPWLFALLSFSSACRVYDPALLDAVRPDGGGDAQTMLDGRACTGSASACGTGCVDLQTDVHNCGTCSNDCTALASVDSALVHCTAGVCDLTGACRPNTGDCDGDPASGCEGSLDTPQNCGRCHNNCTSALPQCSATAAPTPDGGVSDGGGSAPVYACSNGCNAATPTLCGALCVDTNTDPRQCGMCGLTCPGGANGAPGCALGHCSLACATGFGDCNSATVSTDGCETNTNSSLANCGSCGNACLAGPGASAVCNMGTCDLMCSAGHNNCNHVSSDGCESDPTTDVHNCGACGTDCAAMAPTNATGTCASSACGFTCNSGYTRMGTACVLAAPRPLAPQSTATVNRKRPTFQIADLGAGADSVEVQLCRERTCASPASSFTFMGTSGAPPADLAVGAWFWRARGVSSATSMPVSGFGTVWAFHVPAATREPAGGPNTSWGSDHDLNGDGLSDAAVGAYANGSGLVYIYAGRRAAAFVDTSVPVATAPAPAGTSAFGSALASVGDVDGDGLADLAVTALGSNRTFLVRGDATATVGRVQEFLRPAGISPFGGILAGLGDVNGDGYADTAIGGTVAATGATAVVIYLGSASGPTAGQLIVAPSSLASGANFGAAFAAAGDVDGDGLADLVVGAPGFGRATLYRGMRGAATGLTTASTDFGPGGSSRFGAALSGAVDVNGDGYSDLVVGAPSMGSGVVYLFPGSATGVNVAAGAMQTLAGTSSLGDVVVTLGDVNGDGYGDVGLGVPTARTLYVATGSATGLSSVRSLPDSNASFSAVTTGSADYNGDGFSDFSVGLSLASQVNLYQGALGATSFTALLLQLSTSGTAFGSAIAWRSPRRATRWF